MSRLVLLHGFTGSPASWDEVRRLLPSGVDVLAPALAGHGGPAASSFEAEVDRIASLAPGEGFVLAGYSLGARLALGLLVRHPGLARSAVLVGVQPGFGDEAERVRRRGDDERWARSLGEGRLDRFVEEWSKLPLFRSQADLPAASREAQRRIRLGHDPRSLAGALRALGPAAMPCWSDRLPGIRVPVRLVAGERDAKFVALARSLAERLPRADVRIVPGVGHNVILEAPRAVAGLLMEDLSCPV